MKTLFIRKLFISAIILLIVLSTKAQNSQVIYSADGKSGTFNLLQSDCIDGWSFYYEVNVPANTPLKVTYNYNENVFSQIYNNNNDFVADGDGPSIGEGTIVCPNGILYVFIYDEIIGSPWVFSFSFVAGSYTTFSNSYTNGNSIIDGKLGIGTSNPLERLHVDGAIRGNAGGGALQIKTDWGHLDIGPQNWAFTHLYTDLPKFIFNKPIYSMTGEISAYYTTNLSLQTNGSTKMTILNSNGNVGIGTTTPSFKLDVAGNMQATNDFTVSGSGTDIGGSINILNTAKTGAGQASRWTIYNMSGTYGNSLQFWAYDNIGCTSGGICSSRLTLMDNGNVGIGTSVNLNDKLTVNGTIHAKEVKIDVTGFPDYVFDENYKLMPLHEVEQFVKTNSHLPEVPSATEVSKNGLNIGEMQNKLLQKIEELTLYVIEQQKRIEQLEKNQK